MTQLYSFLQERIRLSCTLFLGVLIISGCTHPGVSSPAAHESCHSPSAASRHWLYNYIPENQSQISSREPLRYITWALLGNDDDGIFGEKSSRFIGPPSVGKAVAWQLRNPLHNFCFYVIGSADRQNEELDLVKITKHGACFFHYHSKATTVFADKDTSFYLGLHGNKPFISLRLRYSTRKEFLFYCGWRERGNFGITLAPFKTIKCKKTT